MQGDVVSIACGTLRPRLRHDYCMGWGVRYIPDQVEYERLPCQCACHAVPLTFGAT